MTNDELNLIEHLTNKATPGPWIIETKGNTVQSHAIKGVCSGMSPKSGNAVFISLARKAVPDLIAALRAATQPVQVPALFVDMARGLFICALSEWTESGLPLHDFLRDNGVLGDDDIDLRDMTVKIGTRTQQELDALPEWPA